MEVNKEKYSQGNFCRRLRPLRRLAALTDVRGRAYTTAADVSEGGEVVAYEVDGRVPLRVGACRWQNFLIRHEMYLDEESFHWFVGYTAKEGTEGYRYEPEREGNAPLTPVNMSD